MSNEGYVQIICEKGHYHEEHEGYHHDFDEEHFRCHRCGYKIGWLNHVDTSNGRRCRYIPEKILRERFFLYFINSSLEDDGQAIYRVPTKEETRHLVIDEEDPWDEMLR